MNYTTGLYIGSLNRIHVLRIFFKFVADLFTPSIDLQNFKCNLLQSVGINIVHCTTRDLDFFCKWIKMPQISGPYNKIGLIVWSKMWILVYGYTYNDCVSGIASWRKPWVVCVLLRGVLGRVSIPRAGLILRGRFISII